MFGGLNYVSIADGLRGYWLPIKICNLEQELLFDSNIL